VRSGSGEDEANRYYVREDERARMHLLAPLSPADSFVRFWQPVTSTT
jgi:hypothetical protein